MLGMSNRSRQVAITYILYGTQFIANHWVYNTPPLAADVVYSKSLLIATNFGPFNSTVFEFSLVKLSAPTKDNSF